jgi:hypothetical protein
MSRKNKKLGRTAALAAILSAPVQRTEAAPYDSRTGLQKFTEQYETDQAAEKDAQFVPARRLMAERSVALRSMIELDSAALYSAPSSFLESTAPSIGSGDQWNNVSPDEIRATIRRVFSEFEDSIAASGKLTEAGRQKLQQLSRANLCIDWTQSSAWSQAFYLLRAAGELDEDFIETETPAPSAQPTAYVDVDDEIEKLDTSTRSGQQTARTLLAGQLFKGDAKQVFQEWVASLWNNFDFVPSEAEQKLAIEFCIQRNLSFLDRRTYDTCRRVLISRGIFPERCLTNADRADMSIETADTQSYAGRMLLKRTLASL